VQKYACPARLGKGARESTAPCLGVMGDGDGLDANF
jgi:hypothetical protein